MNYLCQTETRRAVLVRKEAEVPKTIVAASRHIQPFLVQVLRVQRLSVPYFVLADG